MLGINTDLQFSGGGALETLVKQQAVKAFRVRTRSDHVTRNALATRNNAAYGQSNGRTLDTGISLLAVFTLELEMDHPSETRLCAVAPSPQTPLLRFFLREGAAGTDNPVFKSQADCSFNIKTTPDSYSIAKLRRITYLTRIIPDNPSHTNNPSLV